MPVAEFGETGLVAETGRFADFAAGRSLMSINPVVSLGVCVDASEFADMF